MPSIVQTGPASWRALIRIKGHAAVCQTFKTETQARAFAKRTEAALRAGRTVGVGATVADAVREFRRFRDAGTRPITDKSTEHYYLNHLADPAGIGEVLLTDLTVDRLTNWCRDRAEEGAGPSTLKSEVSKLGTVLKYYAAAKNLPLLTVVQLAQPVLEYNGLIGASKQRERRPSADELAKLREALPPLLWDIALVAIGTAMRRGEITRILWADLDLARSRVLVRDRKHPRRKHGNHIVVPLTSYAGVDAAKVIDAQPRTDVRIFPVSTEWVSDTFRSTCDALGIADLHFHDLRHEATSRFFEAGLQIQQVAVLTGHRNWSNLRRYTQITQESLPDLDSHPDTVQRLDSLRI